jgi:hypothetical protein
MHIVEQSSAQKAAEKGDLQNVGTPQKNCLIELCSSVPYIG